MNSFLFCQVVWWLLRCNSVLFWQVGTRKIVIPKSRRLHARTCTITFFIIPLNRKGILSCVFHFFTFSIFPYYDFTSRTLLLSFMIFYSSLFWLLTFIISSVLFCFRVGWEGWRIRIHRTEKLQLKSHFCIIIWTKGQAYRSMCRLPSSLYPET